MPLPSKSRDASRTFSGAGCAARVSPPGANVVAEKADRNGGKSGCIASERAKNDNEEASPVASKESRLSTVELTDASFDAGDDARGSNIHWPARPIADESSAET